MNITYEKVTFGKIGSCLKVSNGKIEFLVACDIGPRILNLKLCSDESVFIYDENDNFNQPESALTSYGNLGGWHIYGGHRLWASPEKDVRTAYPDNRSVVIKEIENGVVVTGECQVNNNIQVEMTITFIADNKISIEHQITNKNAYSIEIAAWPITVMNHGGFAAIKMIDTDTGLLPNRTMSLWPYSKMNDKRVYFGENYITLKADKDNTQAFKFGIRTDSGFAAYFRNKTLFIKRFELDDSICPDYDCNYESYTCREMLEMESLSPLTVLEHNEFVIHNEIHELYELKSMPDMRDETAIAEALQDI